MENIITTLEAAERFCEKFRGETLNLPTLEEYISGLRAFQRESAEWFGIDDSRFYHASRYGYRETCDGDGGGLDVSWAFHRDDVTEKEITDHYISICEELRACLEEQE